MAWVVWFTGLPGCGKTTIAQLVKMKLSEKNINSRTLQLDEIRKAITPQPRYTEEERDIVYASLAYMAKLLAEAGVNVIIDATANRRRYRDFARSIIPNFGEVFIYAPLDICIAREMSRKSEFAPKDIYKKAINDNANVPGINVVYECPLKPEIEVDTTTMNPDESARLVTQRIIDLLEPNK